MQLHAIVQRMKLLKSKINLLVNCYDRNEFLPIRSGDQLVNRDEFIRYKLRCVIIKHKLI